MRTPDSGANRLLSPAMLRVWGDDAGIQLAVKGYEGDWLAAARIGEKRNDAKRTCFATRSASFRQSLKMRLTPKEAALKTFEDIQ